CGWFLSLIDARRRQGRGWRGSGVDDRGEGAVVHRAQALGRAPGLERAGRAGLQRSGDDREAAARRRVAQHVELEVDHLTPPGGSAVRYQGGKRRTGPKGPGPSLLASPRANQRFGKGRPAIRPGAATPMTLRTRSLGPNPSESW